MGARSGLPPSCSREEPHRFLIHDHDSIYSDGVDRTIAAMGQTILKTPAAVGSSSLSVDPDGGSVSLLSTGGLLVQASGSAALVALCRWLQRVTLA